MGTQSQFLEIYEARKEEPVQQNIARRRLAAKLRPLLLRRLKRQVAQESLALVGLDGAWAEWQAAEAAKAGVFDQLADARELKQAEQVEQRLDENYQVILGAYDRHQQTILQLSAASTASANAHATVLLLRQQLAHQKLVLLQALGLPPDTQIELRNDIALSSRLSLPTAEALSEVLASPRLDLVALRRGCDSQAHNGRATTLRQRSQ